MKNKLRIMLALAAMILTLGAGGCRKDDSGPRMTSEIRNVDKLVLSRLTISKMATISDMDFEKAQGLKQSAQAVLNAVKIGDRKGAYSYDTYMTAYIDLSDFSEDDITIDEETKKMTITLPAIQTEFSGRDAALREVHYRVTGLRSNINAGERAAMKEKMNAALKQEVESDETFRKMLVESARAKGERYFEEFGRRYGYETTVNFK